MAIFVAVLLSILVLIVAFHFFGAWGSLLALGMVFLALIIFIAMRGKRHPGDVTLNNPYLIVGRGSHSGPSIEEREQEIRKLSE